MTLKRKAADKPQGAKADASAAASPRPSTGAHARRTDDADQSSTNSTSELKHELSKLNRLLKDIEKLEARALESELSPPLQRKVARKAEIQTRRSAIIAELNGAVATSASASSSTSSSAMTQTKTKKTFVAIEL